jgi:uncharacterized iron-regulated membrane protein
LSFVANFWKQLGGSAEMKLRQVALSLHRYIGYIAGLVLVFIALTGSLLVFKNEIDRFFEPQLLQVVPGEKRVPLQSVVDKVRFNYPELSITSVDMPLPGEGVYKIWSESKSKQTVFLYVNPYNGDILGSRLQEKTLMDILVNLHINLLMGETGAVVVGIYGLLLLILCVTGLFLWPGWKKFASGFKIRWKAPGKLINYDVHKVVGILSVAFLLLIVSTGVAMSFFTQFEKALYSLTATPMPTIPSKSQPAAGRKTVAIDLILSKAEQALPGTQTIWIDLPPDSQGLFRVGKRFSQDTSLSSASSDSQIFVDQYSGKVVRVNTVQNAPLATQIIYSLYSLHIGSYGGLGMRIVYVLIGLAPVGLLFTGLVLWRQRQWAIARRQEAIRRSQQVIS